MLPHHVPVGWTASNVVEAGIKLSGIPMIVMIIPHAVATLVALPYPSHSHPPRALMCM
jgi:hypothetical protein